MRSAFALAAVLIALVAPGLAQLTGTIDGTVLDETGAVISTATLLLSETATGQARTSNSSTDGYFRFVDLRPDSYTLTVHATGFTELKLEGLELTLGQQMTTRPVLKISEVHQIEFRSSFYNLCNNVNLGNPNSSQNSPTFGQILGTGTPRVIEFALRFAF